MAEWMRRTCHQIASSKTTDEDTSSADDVQRDEDTAQEDVQWNGTTTENTSLNIVRENLTLDEEIVSTDDVQRDESTAPEVS